MAEKITAQRHWANGRARNASLPRLPAPETANSVSHRFHPMEVPEEKDLNRDTSQPSQPAIEKSKIR